MSRKALVQARESLLAKITEGLHRDERFVAAWLAGSYGHGEQTWQSDLDMHIVVADAYSEILCTKPWPSGVRTTSERLALFEQFGTPAVIYEDHADAPKGGTVTTVLYATAITVRWTLLPQSIAQRPPQSLLLFENVAVSRQIPHS